MKFLKSFFGSDDDDSGYSIKVKDFGYFFRNNKVALTFDDILLEPQYSALSSRMHANTSTCIAGMDLDVPIISANMDTVTSYAMAKAMEEAGGLGILHRYQSHEAVLAHIKTLISHGCYAVPSIGVKDGDYDKALDYIEASADAICVDIAHGDSAHAIDMVRDLREYIDKEESFTEIIAGNVATFNGARNLAKAGAHVIKVGVGPGSQCTTRRVSGHGVPQLAAIYEVCRVKEQFDVQVIADGGIRDSGDIVKALAFGADAVMIGSLLAGTDETPGEIVDGYKVYRGMASLDAKQASQNGPLDHIYTPEGVVSKRKAKGPVKNVIGYLAGGIRSGMSYSGAYSLNGLRNKARFMFVTSNGLAESHSHSNG